jgi:cell filamentation protein
MSDPYVYPGTEVLRNKEGIRDAGELAQFERLMTAQRLREGLPKVSFTPEGYRKLHHHIFQDVYDWAGELRTVDIAKGGYFCRPAYIDRELTGRFDQIRAEHGLQGGTADQFAIRAAHHLCEVNAIHAFREGNGRAQRALLVTLGEHAGHPLSLQRIDSEAWNRASRESFRTGDDRLMREVVAGALAAAPQQQLGQEQTGSSGAGPTTFDRLRQGLNQAPEERQPNRDRDGGRDR